MVASDSFAAEHARSGSIPMAFVKNPGRFPPAVQFAGLAPDTATYLEDNAFVIRHGGRVRSDLGESTVRGVVLRYSFVGAQADARVDVTDAREGRVNFLLGADPKEWRTGLPTFGEAQYSDLYPGVGMVLREHAGALEYDLILAPGADLSQVAIRCDGADRLYVDASGRLIAEAGEGRVIQSRPVTAELTADGSRRDVACRFELIDGDTYRFVAVDRDPSARLVIDPGITFSGFLGGSNDDHDCGCYIASDCSCYLTGDTLSVDFPTELGAFDSTANGGFDTFVTKIVGIGNALLYSTYVGGSQDDYGHGVVVDGLGRAYVAGGTRSSDFPVTPGAAQVALSGPTDLILMRLSADGSALEWASYLGGSGEEGTLGGQAIALDPQGRPSIGGYTRSMNFPVTKGAPDTTQNDAGVFGDGCVATLSADGSTVEFATYLGGEDIDVVNAISLGPNGDLVIGGWSRSSVFPVTTGAFATTPTLTFTGFVTCFDPDAVGNKVVFSTFTGGKDQIVRDIAVDASGDIYVAGFTAAASVPTTPGAFQSAFGGGTDGFLLKLSPDGTSLIYGSYLGGSGEDVINGVDTDGVTGDAYVVGMTRSIDFPATSNAYDTSHNGGQDAFVSRFTADGATLTYSTFLGGSADDAAYAMEAHDQNSVYVSGGTFSSDFPGLASFDDTANGGEDVFITLLPVGVDTCVADAGVAAYGVGKAGSNGLVPGFMSSAPKVPSPAFQLHVTQAAAFAPAWLIIGFNPVFTPLDGGFINVDPLHTVFVGMTDASGNLDVLAPIAENPNYCSKQLYAQILIQDPGVGSPLGLSMTAGLALLFGK